MVDRRVTQGRLDVQGAGRSPRITFSSGAAQQLQRFSQRMFQISDDYQNDLDRRAEAEARDEGHLDGMSGQPEMRDYATIRGRAYNSASLQSFTTAMETEMIGTMAALESRYRNDPEGLQSAIRDYRRGLVEEMRSINPAAAAAVDQRVSVRSLAAVERARDGRLAIAKDQATASLITNQAALNAEIKTISSGLFSDNPKLSAASSQQIAMLRNDLIEVYSATDPDGRPLYSATQRAKALAQFNDDVMTNATLSWFGSHDDPVAAYMEFTSGDFQINLDAPGIVDVGDDIREYMVEGKDGASHDGLKPSMRRRFAAMMESAPDHIKQGLRVYSGHRSVEHQRQLWEKYADKYPDPSERRKWVAPPGKSKHNIGEAVDLSFNGVRLDKADPEVTKWVQENAPKFGLMQRPNMLHEPWQLELDRDFDPEGSLKSFDIRKALSPGALGKIESEMRSRISFANAMEDRQNKLADEELLSKQEDREFEMLERLMLPDADLSERGLDRLTMDDVSVAVEGDAINPKMGAALLKAIQTDNAKQTDPAVEKMVMERIMLGEDVSRLIVENKSSLSAEKMRTLANFNRSMNGSSGDGFSDDQQFYYQRIKDFVTRVDPFSAEPIEMERLRFAVLSEYKMRVDEGENEREVAEDLMARSSRDLKDSLDGRLRSMPKPRFAVPGANGLLDINASKDALRSAYMKKEISEASAARQAALLKQWAGVQDEIAREIENERRNSSN